MKISQFNFRQLFGIFLVAGFGLLFAVTLQAWTGPTATAPAGNVAAPINVGTTDQVKSAGISVNALTVFGSQYIQNKLGINVTNPLVALDVSGTLRLGNGGEQCQVVSEGSQRYNSTSKVMEYCNGTSWGALAGGAVPPGSVIPVVMASCPSGYLAANGSAVSRTTYVSLFTAISIMYGSGDGSTTFTLPDLRGYFLRGWANGSSVDPDRASRTNRGDGTTGDSVGTKQSGQFGSHTHTYGQFTSTSGVFGGAQGSENWGSAYGTQTTDTGSAGSSETRPVNVNVLYCIKY